MMFGSGTDKTLHLQHHTYYSPKTQSSAYYIMYGIRKIR